MYSSTHLQLGTG